MKKARKTRKLTTSEKNILLICFSILKKRLNGNFTKTLITTNVKLFTLTFESFESAVVLSLWFEFGK